MIREHLIKRFTRSRYWSKVRKIHLSRHNVCAICGKTKKLEVHHIDDFSSHPELELDPNNLITLCRGGMKCHRIFGHLGNWKYINPRITIDAYYWNKKIKQGRENYANS